MDKIQIRITRKELRTILKMFELVKDTQEVTLEEDEESIYGSLLYVDYNWDVELKRLKHG